MSDNFFTQILKGVGEIILDFIYFPIWWYSGGLKKMWHWVCQQIILGQRGLGITIQFRYLFKPMYGDYSKSGRLISFFVRLIKLAIFLLIFLLWVGLIIALLGVWLGLPILIIYKIIY
ncbi:MAG: hypothetical protein PHS07_02455 [Patescibacteria group bacterium]|nr:hypothetical protein [Patescibacteria group bacterium]